VRVVLHPEALSEFQAAAFWYDDRRHGLGEEFTMEATALIARVAVTPRSFPSWPGVNTRSVPIRRAVMERFYLVAFEAHIDRIVILAIPHGKRRPLYWLVRAAPPPA